MCGCGQKSLNREAAEKGSQDSREKQTLIAF
jgi:hypothetical protein